MPVNPLGSQLRFSGLDTYRQHIVAILDEYASYKLSRGEVERERIIDPVHDHYHLINLGWDGYKRIHGTLIHIDIRDGKIWVRHDGTEAGVANLLVEAGVPRQDIVLGFHAPYEREYTDFAVG